MPESAVDHFLASGAAFGGIVPDRIDTHAASIFLAGDRAWKLKRPVSLGYLDFSTPARRRAALEAELALNRRTAPDLYLAVHPIARDGAGALAIDGAGEVVDWLLEMRRFASGALLAEQERLAPELAIRLADGIARFHDDAEVAVGSDGTGPLRAVIAGNAAAFARYPRIIPHDAAARLTASQQEAIDARAGQLDARARGGRVRRGHGDLHLANIAIIDGEPTLFDCLEFDARLATVDLLYDLAFLLMDLWERGWRDAANLIVNRYLDLSGRDEDGVALLPLFMSLRAAVRAHVAAAAAGEREGGDKAAEARRYLALAEQLLQPAPPRLIAIGGLSGSGKSTLARALGASIGAPPGARVLRSDVLRKRLAGLAPEQRLPPARYTAASSARVYRTIDALAGQLLRAGGSAIGDAMFARQQERAAIAAIAEAAGARFDGLWLEAPLDRRLQRVGTRHADASDADAAVLRRQQSDPVLPPWRSVTAAEGAEATAARVRALLGLG